MTTKVFLKTRDNIVYEVKNGIVNFNGVTATFIDADKQRPAEVSIANLDFINAEMVAGDPIS